MKAPEQYQYAPATESGLFSDWYVGPQAIELGEHVDIRAQTITLQNAALAIAHKERRGALRHKLLGHRIFIRRKPDELNALVVVVLRKLGETGAQQLANGTVFSREFGKDFLVLVDAMAQAFIIDIEYGIVV